MAVGQALKVLNPQNRVIYDMLVNDLGLSCSGDVCDITQRVASSTSPEQALEEALSMAQSNGVEFTVTTERYMRNWGFRRMKKIFKSPEWREEYGRLGVTDANDRRQWRLASDVSGSIVLFEERGPSWIAKCPIIMGAYYACLLGRAGDEKMAMSKVVIDLCAPTDRDKVAKGAETAFSLFRPRRRQDVIMSVLCDPHCETMLPLSFFAMDVV